jgi:hypothetical protein
MLAGGAGLVAGESSSGIVMRDAADFSSAEKQRSIEIILHLTLHGQAPFRFEFGFEKPVLEIHSNLKNPLETGNWRPVG